MSAPPLCIVTYDHPLREAVVDHPGIRTVFVDGDEPPPLSPGEGGFIVDLCLFKTPAKKKMLDHLSESDFRIISDLTVNWAEGLHRLYPLLRVSAPLAFYSPNKTYEYYGWDEEASCFLQDFLGLLGLRVCQVSEPGIGFHYPRTVAMVINEAYFCLEEGLASREDIDGAVKYGVNYPLGPFEWAEKIGIGTVVDLLDELHGVSGEPRYRASRLLRLEAMASREGL